jgi:hypothetical protein
MLGTREPSSSAEADHCGWREGERERGREREREIIIAAGDLKGVA